MFTFLGSSQRFCDGISRRNFLQIGALGAGLTLADLLRLQQGSALGGPEVGDCLRVIERLHHQYSIVADLRSSSGVLVPNPKNSR